MIRRSRRTERTLLALLLASSMPPWATSPVPGQDSRVFGPETFARSPGAPTVAQRSFPARAGTGTLRIENGRADGTGRASSAVVTLNASIVAGPGDFNPRVGLIERPVTLRAQNTLTVEVRSGPNALLTVSVLGVPSTLLFTGPPADPVNSHLPDLGFPAAREADFVPDPDLGGLLVSMRELVVVFEDATTVAQANDLLSGLGGTIAGGIPERKVVLIRFSSIDRLADFKSLWGQLRADPRIRAAAPETEIGFDDTTDPTAAQTNSEVDDWTFTVPPAGDNWHLEAARAPQAWNLADWIAKRGRKARIGIIDTAFDPGHEDLAGNLTVFIGASGTPNDPARAFASHGTQVAGLAAAKWHNAKGIDGVVADRGAGVVAMPAAKLPKRESDSAAWARTLLADLEDLAKNHPDVLVVNTSLGYAWTFDVGARAALDPDTHGPAQTLVQAQGRIYAATRRPFVVVASAGNDAGKQAKWNSPMCYAALVLGATDALCIEAARKTGTNAYALTAGTNVAGSLAAPVEDAVTTEPGSRYADVSGATSFATPVAAGAAAFLRGYRDLDNADLQRILGNGLRTLTASKGMLDLFAAGLGIDSLTGANKQVQRDLVDVDDGTADGNRRTLPSFAAGTPPPDDAIHTTNNAGATKLRGDGQVNLRDFRALRDAFLEHCRQNPGGTGNEPACVDPGDVGLDGGNQHPKRDLNRDGCFNDGTVKNAVRGSSANCSKAPPEILYPRFDFNGDGFTNHRTAPPDDPAPQVRDKTDLDLLADKDLWKTIDSSDGSQELSGSSYSDRVSADGDDLDDDPVTGDCPARYHMVTRTGLLARRNTDARVGGGAGPKWATDLPDYLHSADLTFRLRWAEVPEDCDALAIRIQSELIGNEVNDDGDDATDEPFEKSLLKVIQASRGSREELVVTVPLYTRSVRLSWSFFDCEEPIAACPGSFETLTLKFGEDRALLLPE